MPATRFLVLGVLCLSCFVNRTKADVVYMDMPDLAGQAQQVIVGDILEVTSFWNDSHSLIQRRIVVQVSDYLVGQGSGTEVFEVSGGTIGDLTLNVSFLPVFHAGDHVLLFLKAGSDRLVAGFQGAYFTDGESIVRSAPGCGGVINETLEPLVQFLSRLQQVLPSGTTLPALRPYQGDFVLSAGSPRYATCGASWSYVPFCPMGETYVINANCADAAAGSSDSQRMQILNGANAWNNAGANFLFGYGGPTTQIGVTYDSVNLIYFSMDPPDGGGYIAAAYYWSANGDILECDMVFNDRDYVFWNGSGSCNRMMDIWSIASHEFGHFLCLADLYASGDSQATMYGYSSNCQTQKRDLAPDDINGILALYGPRNQCQPTGACCHCSWCSVTTQSACLAEGGTYQGDNTVCSPNPCTSPATGDLNLDGVINGKDIQGFVNCFLGGGSNCGCGDMNNDGSYTVSDVNAFVQLLLNSP